MAPLHPALRHQPADAVEDAIPVVDLGRAQQVGGDQDVLHPRCLISGDAVAQFAQVVAVPVHPHRNGEVAVGPLGETVKPDSFSQMFDRTVAQLDVPRIRLHDLRHGAATMMLASGANPKTVSERLGHASTAFTMDVYAASVPALEQETAERVAALLD